MKVYTTEITSDSISSDNPIHQRLLKAYVVAEDYIQGDLLEVGCGEGRGLELILPKANSYTAIDKIGEILEKLKPLYPDATFLQANIPPFSDLADDSFDVVLSFQVIEHIKEDKSFLAEIFRVLKPGGAALLTTPNIEKTLTRNPWHIREYKAKELTDLAAQVFDHVEMKGITGNDKIWQYYERNKKSVEKITRFDIFDLQHRLPASLLRIPYEILNRRNRNNLKKGNDDLVAGITTDDYLLSENPKQSLDLLLIARKNSN